MEETHLNYKEYPVEWTKYWNDVYQTRNEYKSKLSDTSLEPQKRWMYSQILRRLDESNFTEEGKKYGQYNPLGEVFDLEIKYKGDL